MKLEVLGTVVLACPILLFLTEPNHVVAHVVLFHQIVGMGSDNELGIIGIHEKHLQIECDEVWMQGCFNPIKKNNVRGCCHFLKYTSQT